MNDGHGDDDDHRQDYDNRRVPATMAVVAMMMGGDEPVSDVKIDEIATHTARVSQMQHLHRRRPVRANLRDHVIRPRVSGKVDEHIDTLLLNALGNCELPATAQHTRHVHNSMGAPMSLVNAPVEQPCHVKEAFDGIYDLATPRAVVVLVEGKGGCKHA